MDPLISRLVCHHFDPPTRTPRHVTIGYHHSKEDCVFTRGRLGHLVRHVFEGTIDVGAFAKIFDPNEIPDKVLSGCDVTKGDLCLREMQASDGPGDLNLAPVILIRKLLGKHPSEILDAFH